MESLIATGSNLPTIQESATTLTPKEAAIVRASQSARIDSFSEGQLFSVVKTELQRAVFVSGMNAKDILDMHAIIEAVCTDLFVKFPTLRIEEFKQAMNLGSRGDFNKTVHDPTFVSVAQINKWIKCFIELKREAVAKEEKRKAIEEKQVEANLSAEEKLRMLEETPLAILEDELKELDGPAYRASVGARSFRFEILFDFLQRKGVLNPTPELRINAYERAIPILTADLFVGDLPKFKREALKEIKQPEYVKTTKEGILQNPFHRDLVKISKEILVLDFLKGLKEMEVDVRDFLSNE